MTSWFAWSLFNKSYKSKLQIYSLINSCCQFKLNNLNINLIIIYFTKQIIIYLEMKVILILQLFLLYYNDRRTRIVFILSFHCLQSCILPHVWQSVCRIWRWHLSSHETPLLAPGPSPCICGTQNSSPAFFEVYLCSLQGRMYQPLIWKQDKKIYRNL